MQPSPPELPARAVVIHGYAHALAALEAVRAPARPACRLVLLSAPAAAGFLGPGWWAALMAALQPRMIATDAADLLDCGSSAGRAMEALRLGLRRLILSPDCAQHAAVLARAAPLGAEVGSVRPEALDLAEWHAARRLAEWLHGIPAR